MQICFSTYVALFVLQMVKQSIKNTPEVRGSGRRVSPCLAARMD